MGILRSEDMELYGLNIHKEALYDIISIIGNLNSVQFIDSMQIDVEDQKTQHHNRDFYKNIKRCEDALGKITEMENEILRFDLDIQRCTNIEGYLQRLNQDLVSWEQSNRNRFDHIEKRLESQTDFLQKLQENFERSVLERNQAIEEKAVIENVSFFCKQQQQSTEGTQLATFSGTLDIQSQERFKKLVFRITRGNCVIYTQEIDPNVKKNQRLLSSKTRDIIRKAVFVVLVPTSREYSQTIQNRINRVIESCNATRYDVPPQFNEQAQRLAEIDKRIIDANSLVRLNEQELENHFKDLITVEGIVNNEETGPCSKIEGWKLFLKREKAIYTTMNLCKPSSNNNFYYTAYIWVQASQIEKITTQITEISQRDYSDLAQPGIKKITDYNITPPTYIYTNEFTEPFQQIVDTYGVPVYKEANPGLFTITTFPFLFGVMFGDLGHGSVIVIFSIYLMFFFKPNKSNPGPLDTVFPARYLFFMMGINAVFCGLIYNDFLGMSVNLFGTCYSTSTGLKRDDCNYPIGLDPIWGIASNKLTTQNSLKMKLSVILGISQMFVGVLLKGANSIHFSDGLTFFFEFLPQVVFLVCTFGYMCLMIILKWLLDWSGNTAQAPSILTLLLKFFLNLGETDPNTADLYQGQPQTQFLLLIAAVICVPLMLIPKPLIKKMRAKSPAAQDNQGYVEFHNDPENPGQTQGKEVYIQEEKPFDFADELVHQGIETIEFVLGCISHTASYLRLWALSLAHSQLSEVFFNKTMLGALQSGNAIAIAIGFCVFAVVTFAVLMSMDAMECFLHTLRLHWVEFQSKFYKAEGHKFAPLSFSSTLSKKYD